VRGEKRVKEGEEEMMVYKKDYSAKTVNVVFDKQAR